MKLTYSLPAHFIEHGYFLKMLSAMDKPVFDDKHIIVTSDYNTLPAVGKNVIVILTAGDERGNPPKYVAQVGWVFKHHQNKDQIGNCYHIPLPYVNGFDGTGVIPITERKYDIFFYGRGKNRKDFIRSIQQIPDKYKTCIKITGDKFMSGLPIREYARLMENSKIVLSPSGNVRCECLRFTEAVKCGCCVVACKHPPLRVFNAVPAIYLNSWDQLNGAIEKTLDTLVERSVGMRAGWDNYFSPKAVAEYITRIITR